MDHAASWRWHARRGDFARAWEASDRKLSDAITTYWSNFARTGNPNGRGLPRWSKYEPRTRRVLHLDESIRETPEAARARYVAIDAFVDRQRTK